MFSLTSAIIETVGGIVGKFVKDKDLETKLSAELSSELNDIFLKELEAQKEIIKAEVGAGGVATTWRPHLMYLFMFIIAFNAIAVPIAFVFGIQLPVLDAMNAIPDQMWTLITVAMGGYILGRSGEKIIKNFKE